MITNDSKFYTSTLAEENSSRNKSTAISTNLNLIRANYRLGRLADFITSTVGNDQALRNYFNFSYKSSVPAFKERERELALRYAGKFISKSIQLRLEMAKTFGSKLHGSPEELNQMQTLLKHRQILHDLTGTIENQPIEQSVPLIQSRIDALSNPESPYVVFVSGPDEEYTSFSFPGGCYGRSPKDTHTILFECRRNKQNTYFFVIHNRGKGQAINDIHGPIGVISPTNKKYRKTSVPIYTSKAKLLDRQFLTTLLSQLYLADKISEIYAFIKSHFASATSTNLQFTISSPEQVILEKKQKINTITQKIDDIQKEAAKTLSQRETLKKLAEEKIVARNECLSHELALIQNDNTYHSLQKFGTCSDSCLTGPEKQMASTTLHRKLKLYSIEKLAQDLEQLTLHSTQAENDKALLLEHSKVRALMIRTKLQQTLL